MAVARIGFGGINQQRIFAADGRLHAVSFGCNDIEVLLMQAALEQPFSSKRQMIGGVGYTVGSRTVARRYFYIEHGDIDVIV